MRQKSTSIVVLILLGAALARVGTSAPPESTADKDSNASARAADGPFDKPDRQGAEFGNNSGGSAFRLALGDGAVLVGCEVTLGRYSAECLIIKSVKPIYELPDGTRKDGTARGQPSRWAVRVEAEKGYAVGRMTGRAGDRIDGFNLVFMRRTGNRLDPNDQYLGRWLGTKTGNPLVEVGGKETRPAIGLKGRCGADVDALSLVFE